MTNEIQALLVTIIKRYRMSVEPASHAGCVNFGRSHGTRDMRCETCKMVDEVVEFSSEEKLRIFYPDFTVAGPMRNGVSHLDGGYMVFLSAYQSAPSGIGVTREEACQNALDKRMKVW